MEPKESTKGERSCHRVGGYVNHRCVFADGTPSPVPAGQRVDEIPPQFVRYCNEKKQSAHAAWEKTKQWRIEEGIYETIHSPPSTYAEVHRRNPVFIHGWSKSNHGVVYEKMNSCNLKTVFDNLPPEEHIKRQLIMHEFCMNELLFQRDPSISMKDFGYIFVLDIEGVDVGLLLKSGYLEARDAYLKKVRQYYPKAIVKMFVLNPPRYLSTAVSLVLRSLMAGVVVPETINRKDQILETLSEYVDVDQIPAEYGGTNPHKLGEHPIQVHFDELMTERLQATYPDFVPAKEEAKSHVDSSIETVLEQDTNSDVVDEASTGVVSDGQQPACTDASCRNPVLDVGVKVLQAPVIVASTILFGILSLVHALHEIVDIVSTSSLETSPESSYPKSVSTVASTALSEVEAVLKVDTGSVASVTTTERSLEEEEGVMEDQERPVVVAAAASATKKRRRRSFVSLLSRSSSTASNESRYKSRKRPFLRTLSQRLSRRQSSQELDY